MILSSNYKPNILQTYGTGVRQQLDRVQSMNFGGARNPEVRKEVGTDGNVGYRFPKPSVPGTINQKEYGEFDTFQALANSSAVTLTQASFRTSAVDILGFSTDDDGTFLGTTWYPKQRLAGFSINIGSPEDDVERAFSLVGEDKKEYYGTTNKYVIELISDTVASGENGSYDIIIGSGSYSNYPDPVEDPDNSGYYIERVVKIPASGTGTDLVQGTDFTYTHGTTTVNIVAATVGDVYKVIYAATTFVNGASTFTSNTSDLSGINADSVSVYLEDTNGYQYRLQNVGIDVAFNRFDAGEIGNDEMVTRGVRETTVSISLGKNLENYTLEEYLRGVSAGHGKIDIRKYIDTAVFIVKFYSDSDKTSYKYGIRATGLTVSDDGGDNVSIDNYVAKSKTLIGYSFTLSTSESVINGS